MNITIDVTDSPSLYIQIKKNNKIMHLEIFVNELKEFLNAD
jgi:hypothetical protein